MIPFKWRLARHTPQRSILGEGQKGHRKHVLGPPHSYAGKQVNMARSYKRGGGGGGEKEGKKGEGGVSAHGLYRRWNSHFLDFSSLYV